MTEKLVHLHAICYNEKVVLPFFFKHYKKMFGDSIKFTIYDNESNDGSQEICLSEGAEIITYYTNNQLSDSKYLEIKNNCWKNQQETWALVLDIDEALFITKEELLKEQELGTSIIKSEGWNMISIDANPSCKIDIEGIKYGTRATQYDKNFLFDTKRISEINYSAGCHWSTPVGEVKFSENSYKLLHYKALSEDYIVERYKMFSQRMSAENIEKKWAWHYMDSEETLRRNHKFFQQIEGLTKVID